MVIPAMPLILQVYVLSAGGSSNHRWMRAVCLCLYIYIYLYMFVHLKLGNLLKPTNHDKHVYTSYQFIINHE